MNRNDLIAEIAAAFGRFPPRGLRITIDSDMGDYPDVRKHFHHRDWWTCDAAYLKQQDGAFSFVTDEARVYFTPAYMTASLASPAIADTVPDNFVLSLNEPLLRGYNGRQLKSIIRFIELHLPEEPWKMKDWRATLALVRKVAEEGPQEEVNR